MLGWRRPHCFVFLSTFAAQEEVGDGGAHIASAAAAPGGEDGALLRVRGQLLHRRRQHPLVRPRHHRHFTAQQQQEGGGSLELAGLPGNHHCPMVKHRARFIHCCHCSRSMGGMLAFVKWRCKESYISSCLLMNEVTRQASSKSF